MVVSLCAVIYTVHLFSTQESHNIQLDPLHKKKKPYVQPFSTPRR
jgi:hypothetical protein